MINNPSLGPSLGTLTPESFVQKLVPGILTLILTLGIIIFFFYFLLGAISWITSGGDKASTQAAKEKVTQALVGLVILLSSYAIFRLIETVFSVNIINFSITPFF